MAGENIHHRAAEVARANRATKVAPSISIGHPNGALAVSRTFTVNAKDAELLNELVRYAIESMNATIALEEQRGKRAPILDTLREYVSAATDLLARIGVAR